MHVKYLIAISLAFMILFSASIPVYASHTRRVQPTEDERRLFEKIFDRLEAHDEMIDTKIADVKDSLSKPVKIFFSCRSINTRSVQSVTIDVSTQFVSFDEKLAEQHREGMLGGVYIWDCKAVKDSYSLTIECTNMLMLNPTFIVKEETETGEKRLIAMAENEMTLYHEFLHGQLMINAMKDNSDALGWRADACRFFADNGNLVDYSPSDSSHEIISTLELEYLAKLIEQRRGALIFKTIDNQVGAGRFTQVMADFEELGELVELGFFVFARTVNLEGVEVLVSKEAQTVSVSASLQDQENDAIVRMYIMPRMSFSDARIELEVDDAVKSVGSEFVFTAKVHNTQTTDLQGSVTLFIDGSMIGGKQLNLPAGRTLAVEFTWGSADEKPSMHSVKVDGFGSASNEVNLMTFDKLLSATVRSDDIVAEQTVIDPNTGKQITVARPNRISATIMVGETESGINLVAPDGTLVIGKEGLVNKVSNRVNLVEVGGETLIVKYTDLNAKLRFFAVKSTMDKPLQEGEWLMKAVDIAGQDADLKIRYYASYVKTIS